MSSGLISADSHLVEPPELFDDYLASRWREHRPRLVADPDGGECYRVPGLSRLIGLGLAAAAGSDPASLRETGSTFASLRPGAWQAPARLVDQTVDGVRAEVLHPTVGLFLLHHVNREFVAACMTAYNRWLAERCRVSPARLVGCGVSSCDSPAEAVRDVLSISAAGLRGVLLPLEPAEGHYFDSNFDVLWSAAVECGIPVTFHALPPRRQATAAGPAAPALLPIWEVQELLAGLIFGGVLRRFPTLKVVFAEFDAGWVPHFLQRLDHYFQQHFRRLKLDAMIDAPPSEYVRRSVYFTFQDDETALHAGSRAGLNLMWGSDFPHAESTWPSSRGILRRAKQLGPHVDVQKIFSGNAAALYGLPPSGQVPDGLNTAAPPTEPR